MGSPPVGAEETIGTIMRHQQRTNIDGPQNVSEFFKGWQDLTIYYTNLGEIIVN